MRFAATSLRTCRSHDVDMTKGSIARHIISFAFPLLLGNLFQQLYNTIDTWVVGNYVSNDAYSAVGAVAPIVNMLIGAFTGLSSGAGVVISQYYGAQQKENVQKAVHTAIVMTLILSVLFTAVGLLITPYMLKLVNLHKNASDDATLYLNIYFSGITGLLFYNMGAAILRAVGDSRRPFYYLLICALLNTALDLVFVLAFNMGVEGVALATIISQAVSAVLVIVSLLQTDGWIKLRKEHLKLDKELLVKILVIGTPAALQLSVTSFSNVFVQSYISHFDVGRASPDYMSGWTSYLKIDMILFLPIQSIALAVSTFVGQNLGCKQVARAKRGVHTALCIAILSTILLMIPLMLFAPQIVGFLNSRKEVVEIGALMLHVLTPFYIFSCFNQIYASALRGAGNTRAPMVIMMLTFVGFRQLYLIVMSRICNEVVPIILGYPAAWLLCSLATVIYFYKVRLDKIKVT